MLKKIKKVGYQLLLLNNNKLAKPIFFQMKNVQDVYYNGNLYYCSCSMFGSNSYQISKKYLQFFSTKKQNKSQDNMKTTLPFTDSKNFKQQKLDTKSISQYQKEQNKQNIKNYLQKQKNNNVVTSQKNQKDQKNQNDQKNKQQQKEQQKGNVFDLLIPIIGFPIMIYFMWDSHVQKKETYTLIKTKIKITEQQNKVETKSIDFQQIEKKLQPLFYQQKQKEKLKLYVIKQFSQWEKSKTIKVIINDQDNKRLVGLKKFILKKQNENHPVLFIDLKDQRKDYQWLTYHVGLKQFYGPVVSSQLLYLFRTLSFINQFNSQLIVIVINFSQQMKKINQNNNLNISNTSNISNNISQQQELLNEKKQDFFQRLQQMQTSYQRQRLKANIILVFNNQKDYEQIMKQRESSFYQMLK